MTLYKRIDGRIRDDVFSTTIPPGYIISPLNRYSFTGTALQLQHDNLDDVRVLVDIAGPCAVEITADYTPTVASDTGGLILFSDSAKTAEFLERSDTSINQTVSRWRVMSANGSDWDFYSDSGNGFNFIDSTLGFTPKKIGTVLKKGNGTGFLPLNLKRITMTLSDRLLVVNVGDGMTVELLDDTNTLVTSAIALNGVVSLVMPRLLIQGKIRIKNGSTIVEEVSGLFAGGDRYDSGSTLKILVDATTKEELKTTDLTDIGLMLNGILQKKLYLYNPSSTAALNATIAIDAYNSKFGYQWADIARDVSGSAGTYVDEINYTTLTAGQIIPFWLRVVQASDYDGFDPLQFVLDLQHV